MEADKNFDELIERFEQRIYATGKGDWRLKLLQQDLESFHLADNSLTVWDAGCGLGQIALWLAKNGHQLTMCDLSEKMLNKAQQAFVEASLNADFHHTGFQQLAVQLPNYDLIVFHAVLEWLARPLEGLQVVMDKVKPGGYLSLLFYNRNAMVYKNVLKGQWRLGPILDDSYIGKGNKLSPPNPQYPHEIEEALYSSGFEITQHTGIRVFHDYMTEDTLAKTDTGELFALEARYCRMPVYRDMGRYIHLLAWKKADRV